VPLGESGETLLVLRKGYAVNAPDGKIGGTTRTRYYRSVHSPALYDLVDALIRTQQDDVLRTIAS